MVRARTRAIRCLLDRHPGVFAKQLGEHARLVTLEVLDDDEGQPAVGSHVGEELLERLQRPGRGADADYHATTRS